jgi:radical SAM superfamily enzyme YgiQ (UPF0313 family)
MVPSNQSDQKILLVLLPFWAPFIPPIGIACLKSHLNKYDYDVKTVDANVEIDFTDLYDRYFNILRDNVPENKRGNFFAVGHDILRNQMTAFLNYKNEAKYIELIKVLIRETFFVEAEDREVSTLAAVVREFFDKLEPYILGLLERENPSVLGLSVFSDTLPASMFAFKLTRERYPHIRTMMGGGVFADQLAVGTENFNLFLEKTVSYIDKIFVGEGELLLTKWLRGELPDSKRVYTFNDINRETLDLSSAGLLEMRDFDCRNYPFIVSYASRSCPFQCSFCSETIQWGRYRKKKARQVFDELKALYNRHKRQMFLLSDSLLNPVIQDLAAEFRESDVSLYWGGWLRVDKQACDSENTLQWRRGGFYHARLGIESGSQQVLELMGKQITLEEIRASISSLAEVGIKTTTLWIVGHPGETEEDFQKTLDLIEELRNDIYEAECRPFYFYLTGQPGSTGNWWGNMKKILLYPGKFQDMLLFKTWILDCEPNREITYERMNRFVRHCEKQGIPNPYSMRDIYRADERWKKLHKNAVPSVVEFKDSSIYIDECKNVQKLNLVNISIPEASDEKEYIDFGF